MYLLIMLFMSLLAPVDNTAINCYLIDAGNSSQSVWVWVSLETEDGLCHG